MHNMGRVIRCAREYWNTQIAAGSLIIAPNGTMDAAYYVNVKRLNTDLLEHDDLSEARQVLNIKNDGLVMVANERGCLRIRSFGTTWKVFMVAPLRGKLAFWKLSTEDHVATVPFLSPMYLLITTFRLAGSLSLSVCPFESAASSTEEFKQELMEYLRKVDNQAPIVIVELRRPILQQPQSDNRRVSGRAPQPSVPTSDLQPPGSTSTVRPLASRPAPRPSPPRRQQPSGLEACYIDKYSLAGWILQTLHQSRLRITRQMLDMYQRDAASLNHSPTNYALMPEAFVTQEGVAEHFALLKEYGKVFLHCAHGMLHQLGSGSPVNPERSTLLDRAIPKEYKYTRVDPSREYGFTGVKCLGFTKINETKPQDKVMITRYCGDRWAMQLTSSLAVVSPVGVSDHITLSTLKKFNPDLLYEDTLDKVKAVLKTNGDEMILAIDKRGFLSVRSLGDDWATFLVGPLGSRLALWKVDAKTATATIPLTSPMYIVITTHELATALSSSDCIFDITARLTNDFRTTLIRYLRNIHDQTPILVLKLQGPIVEDFMAHYWRFVTSLVSPASPSPLPCIPASTGESNDPVLPNDEAVMQPETHESTTKLDASIEGICPPPEPRILSSLDAVSPLTSGEDEAITLASTPSTASHPPSITCVTADRPTVGQHELDREGEPQRGLNEVLQAILFNT